MIDSLHVMYISCCILVLALNVGVLYGLLLPFHSKTIIAGLSHASKNIGQEIIKNLSILYGANILKNKITLHKEKTVLFIDCLDKNISDSLLTKEDKNFLHQVSENFLIYGRANIKNEKFTSEIYFRHNKTNNYTVQIINSSDFAMAR